MQHNFFSSRIKCNHFFFSENTSGRKGIPSLTSKSIIIEGVQDKGTQPKLFEANNGQKTITTKTKLRKTQNAIVTIRKNKI